MLFQSERGIGRGEMAESRLDFPLFAGLMVLCAVGLVVVNALVPNSAVTVVLAVSLVVFGLTVVRVDFGVYILVVAMLLSPEINLGTVGRANDRGINIRYDDVLIIVIFLGVCLSMAFDKRKRLWQPSPINLPIVLYYGILILSFFLAWQRSVPAWDKPSAVFLMLKMAEFYMVFFLVGNAIRDRSQIRRQLGLFFVVGIVVSLYGIVTIGVTDRVGAPLEEGGSEPNTLGGYLMILMCVAGGLYVYAPHRRHRLLMIALFTLAFIPFLYTLSRASYISLLVALVALGLVGRQFRIVAFVVAVLALSPLLMPDDVMQRVNYTFQEGSGKELVIAGKPTSIEVDTSTYERLYVWKKVRYNMLVWPFFGGGPSWDTVLDSQYARVLIETGLAGFAAFCLMLYQLLRTAREAHRWSRDWVGRGLALGMVATTIGLMVHGLGTISFLIVRIMEPYWFLMAMTAIVRTNALQDYADRVRVYRAEHAAQVQSQPPPGPSPGSAQRPVPSHG